MRYVARTDIAPEEVLARAKRFFAENTRMQVASEQANDVTFKGDIGTSILRIDRAHGYTSVHAETDREAGLDVTDVTLRFLYTLGHV